MGEELSIYENSKTLEILNNEETMNYVNKILNDKSAQFITSMLSVVGGNPELQKCTPTSIMGCCIKAATLDLPIDPSLGLAYPVPFGGSCSFQLGYRGYVQLAMRTGQYKKLNVVEVRYGEIFEIDEFTETYKFCKIPNETKRQQSAIVGYYAYFELINGFRKELYWSIERLLSHAKKYSKSFNSSQSGWKTAEDAMCRKTMIKQLISKWGIMSVQMQQAVAADMARVEYDKDGKETITYDVGIAPIDSEIVEIEVNKVEEEFKTRRMKVECE